MNENESGLQTAGLTFWDHLDELRSCLLRMLAMTVGCGAVAFCFKDELFSILLAPKRPDFPTYRLLESASQWFSPQGGLENTLAVQLINTGLAAQFMIHLQAALYAGLLCASPYLLYALLRFISPALYVRERSLALRLVGSGYAMFLLGVAVNYFLIFPLTFRFLGSYQVSTEVANTVTLQSYMDTMMTLSLAMGIVFEIPVLCRLLSLAGLLTRRTMRRYRRHAIVAVVAVAAIITPTSDIFTLLIVSLPMWLLYEISIFLVRAEKKR